jgi:CRP-like cAMP-binding protein
MPYPIRTVQLERPHRAVKPASLEQAREILEKQELFASLDEEQRTQLLEHSAQLRFGRGETMIQQGQEGSSMFIILEGEAVVSVRQGDKAVPVATLHAGEAFGEMSLLTGEPRSASIVAQSDCEVCEIHRRLLQPLLQANGDLAARLSDMLAQRKMATEGLLAEHAERATSHPKHKEYASGFLQKMRSLFDL